MPIKDRKTELKGFNELIRPMPAVAPYLLMGHCSDCGLEPIVCGDGDIKVCPKCYSLLWHRDFGEELRRKRLEAAEASRLRLEMLRRAKAEMKARAKAEMKARAKAGSHQSAYLKPGEGMRLRREHLRLIKIMWWRAQMLWREREDEPGGMVGPGDAVSEAGSGMCGQGGQEVSGRDDKPADLGRGADAIAVAAKVDTGGEEGM
jgi:hypothetical protein